MALQAWALMVSLVVTGAMGAKPEFSAAATEDAASATSPAVGEPAPQFTLPDQDDETVRLKDHRGRWVVLYFYPKDDTPGCICEATEFTELLFRFKDMNAVVYGVSEDTSESHRRFIDKFALGMNLLSDPDHEVMRSYGAWAATTIGGKPFERVIRSTVLVGPDGLIRHHWPEVIPKGHAERVRKRLAELQRGESESE